MKRGRKEFVVFGLGKFGESIAIMLGRLGCNVLAVDKSEEKVEEVSQYVTHAVQADATDIDSLKTLGVSNFDVAVVAISQDMQSSIMATMLVKDLGVNYIIAKAQNELHKKVLERIGADRIVFPEREMGARLARNLVANNIMDYMELSDKYSIVEIGVRDEWIGKTLVELNMRARFGLNVVAIRGEGGQIDVSPGAQRRMNQTDILVVIGSNQDIKRVTNLEIS